MGLISEHGEPVTAEDVATIAEEAVHPDGEPRFRRLIGEIQSGEILSPERKAEISTNIRNMLHRNQGNDTFIRMTARAAGLSDGEYNQLVQEAHDPKYWGESK